MAANLKTFGFPMSTAFNFKMRNFAYL